MLPILRRSLIVAAAAALMAQPADPVSRARQFIDLLAQQAFYAAHSLFDESMAVQVPTPALTEAWQQVQRGAGNFRRMTTSRVESGAKADTVFVTCEFENATLDARLPIDKSGRVAGMEFALHVNYTAPTYVDQSLFHEKELLLGSGDWSVHGTLTIPNGEGPFRVLVLIPGSGASDRDATIGPNQPFKDIAWGLASRGVAVLRYNQRANEHPKEFAALTQYTAKDETTDDAVAAATLLRSISGLQSKRIFVLGHGPGGMMVPRIGKADPEIAGLIALAGPTRSLLDTLVPRTIRHLTLHGPLSAAQEEAVARLREQVARANDPALTADASSAEMPLGIPASYWLDLRGYRPEQTAALLKQPMLILQGERDYQVTMEDYAAWKQGLAAKKNAEFRSYPKLNHLFMPGEGQRSDEEYASPGHVAGAVVEDIAAWVKRQ